MISPNDSAGKKQWKGLALGLTLIALGSVLTAGTGQARIDVPPVSLGSSLPGIRSIDSVVMPPVDEAIYLQEDQDRLTQGTDGPQRFAAPLETHLTPATDGTWSQLSDGSRVWRLDVISVGARTLNFGLTTFRLPPGAMVHVYPAGSPEYWGAYTAEDATDGQLWSPVVKGDEAVIELFVPAHPAFDPELVIGQVSHDYRGFLQIRDRIEKSGTCNNDVICPEGDPWRDEIASEGVYTRSGIWYCSGQMINSHVNPPPAYFHTAYHCGISSSNASSVVIYWNFQSPTCGQQGGGSLAQYSNGTVFKAKWSTSDFCLVQLSQTPDPAFNLYLAGFDATEAYTPAHSTCIHHPNCDEKAISFDYNAPTITSYLDNSVPGNGTHWRIIQWDDGTTEAGSSGSGLWDPNHRLVGQLHGGYASCTSLTSDWFGRLSRSWDGGGTSTTRLRDWLDPNNTGDLVLDGRYHDAVETGACCGADGTCQAKTSAECASLGGTYQGSGTDCTPNPCPQPAGACCFASGFCLVMTSSACSSAGGQIHLGNGTSCQPNLCLISSINSEAVAGEVTVRLAPNPARDAFDVFFSLPKAASVGVEVYDAAGRVVLARPSQRLSAGDARFSLESVGRDGARLSPGLYLVRLTVDGRKVDSRKLILVP